MNKVEAIFPEIESLQFSARIGLASGFESSLTLARSERCVQDLWTHNDPTDVEAVRKRTLELSAVADEPPYRHLHDDALTVYLWFLFDKNQYVAFSAAQAVMTRSTVWRSRRMAQRVIQECALTEEFQDGSVGLRKLVQNSDSSWSPDPSEFPRPETSTAEEIPGPTARGIVGPVERLRMGRQEPNSHDSWWPEEAELRFTEQMYTIRYCRSSLGYEACPPDKQIYLPNQQPVLQTATEYVQ